MIDLKSISEEKRFRLLVNAVVDYAIYMLDPEAASPTGIPAPQLIKGYTADEIVGEHFSRFYTEEDRAAGEPERALETALREGKYEARSVARAQGRHAVLGQRRDRPDLRREWRAHRLRQDHPRHRPSESRRRMSSSGPRRARPVAEAAGAGRADRRHRARLQQSDDGHRRLDRLPAAPPDLPSRQAPAISRGDLRNGRPGDRAHQPAAGLRPAPGAQARGDRRSTSGSTPSPRSSSRTLGSKIEVVLELEAGARPRRSRLGAAGNRAAQRRVQCPRRDAGRRPAGHRHRRHPAKATSISSASPSPTPAPGMPPATSSSARSSRSSPPRKSARAPGSACRKFTASRPRPAGGPKSSPGKATGRPSRSSCPARTRSWPQPDRDRSSPTLAQGAGGPAGRGQRAGPQVRRKPARRSGLRGGFHGERGRALRMLATPTRRPGFHRRRDARHERCRPGAQDAGIERRCAGAAGDRLQLMRSSGAGPNSRSCPSRIARKTSARPLPHSWKSTANRRLAEMAQGLQPRNARH